MKPGVRKVERFWSVWAARGSAVMATVAALALGVTVFVAEHALSDASAVIVRGEGDALLTEIAGDLTEAEGAPSKELLERVMEAHASSGVRYVAVVGRGELLADAGHPELPSQMTRPGEPIVQGKRVRVVGMVAQRRGLRRIFGRDGTRVTGPPPVLVVEFESTTLAQLRSDLARIGVVAALSGAVLVVFAVALSRSAKRLTALEERASREQRLVALGSMSSVMAHELRNPLASLKGHAQLLAEDLESAGDEKRKKKAERVVAEAVRIEELTTSLLDFVRDGPIERVRIAPAALVERALADLDKDRVRVVVEDAPALLEVDANRLARALHNLVDNALDLGGKDALVALRVARAGAGVLFEVRDHGPGLPPGSEAHIFEPFVTTRVRGTGLGLAVARRIAEQHDGTLVGENHPEGGAVFSLRLPLTKDA